MSHTDGFASASSLPSPGIVLDTNVVLDWLVFRSADSAPLRECLTQGKVRWLASTAMRDELFHVLARGTLAAWFPNSVEISAAWDRYCLPVDALAPTGAASRLRCTDQDDQKFIDLAVAHGARWLLSKDRAVLKLARRARLFGVEILAPAAWAARQTSVESPRDEVRGQGTPVAVRELDARAIDGSAAAFDFR